MDYYNIPEFDATGLVTTVYTSEGRGCWLSNNPEGWENYREVLAHFGLGEENITATFQRHSDSVQIVTRKEARRHVFYRPDPMVIADGIITAEPGLMISSMESDCTPVYLLDPVRKVIGMIHSGWKGTASLISVRAVQLMEKEFSCRAEDIMVAFGPCICRDCYEVGEDIIPPFAENFSEEEIHSFFIPKDNGKYLLDVNKAISISLMKEGVKEANIYSCGQCTYHGGKFYSHRRQLKAGLSGKDNMFTGIMLNIS
ncbi:MAG: peptidoglycan editing factor PgeF [Eubacteriales bacterium]|nr:peptidoglycan editing factor PgeF [Eubacteriales bacterium]